MVGPQGLSRSHVQRQPHEEDLAGVTCDRGKGVQGCARVYSQSSPAHSHLDNLSRNRSVLTVLDQLAAVADLLASGEAPAELAPFLGGASLFALSKYLWD